MVMRMGLETENKDIETNLREIARGLLKEKKVDVIIGYMKGTLPLLSQPIIIDSEEDVDKLIWNNLCYVNLAKYLSNNHQSVLKSASFVGASSR